MDLNILLNNLCDDIDKKIVDLKKEAINLDYTLDFQKELAELGDAFVLPYQSDFLNKKDFDRYYEIEGEIELLTFLKEQVIQDALDGGFSNVYDYYVNDDKELFEVPIHMKLGSIKALSNLFNR